MKKIFAFIILFWIAKCDAQTYPSNIDESKVPPYTLPNVLKMKNGKEVKTKEDWNNIQRPYIYHLYEDIQFGRYPKPKVPIKFSLLEKNDQALDGIATRKQVRIYLHPTDTTVYVDVLMYFPNKIKKPVPVFVGLNFSGNNEIQNDPAILLTQKWVSTKSKGAINNKATVSSRGAEASQWQVKEILSHGYAVATAYYGDLEPDNPEGWETGIRTTLQQQLKIKPEEWDAMGAWAYGLSRIMDYFEKDKDVNAKKVAIVGHLRPGKAAL